MHTYKALLSLLGLLFCVACGAEAKRMAACEEATKRALPLSAVLLSDLSSAFFSASTPAKMSAFLHSYPVLLRHFFEQPRYADLSRLNRGLAQMTQDPHIDTLRQDVALYYGELSVLRQQLAVAWASVQVYDPNFVPPVVHTIVSGLYKDLYLSDSLIIIGLDYFIGPSARYKPQGLPMYLLRRYTPQHLVPTLMLYISQRYDQTNVADATLLSDMIAMGKAYAFVQHMLPCVPDSTLLGYTPADMQAIHENQDIIWAYFVQNQLLYERSPRLKEKFVGERPRVYEIGTKCPPRIGHWLGWQVVRAYLQRHPGDKLQALRALLAEEDAKKVLSRSGYSPGN